jgi:hypothetical protein
MSGVVRNTSTSRRWRSVLRAGAVAAALAVIAGVPLAAQAHDGRYDGWRGHDRGWHDGWRGHDRGWHDGWRGHGGPHYGYRPYYGGPRYYAPSYGYYSPGYYAPAPGVGLNFVIR